MVAPGPAPAHQSSASVSPPAAPTSRPVYQPGRAAKLSARRSRSWGLDDTLDAVFFAVTGLLTCWLAWEFLRQGLHLRWTSLAWLVVFWAALAYLALPRLHQTLTWLYVPDYFIGRTRSGDGVLGDPVNLAAWGSEAALHTAMTAAGWVRADPITLGSSLRIVTASLLRRPYPSAPVSNLTLFGRPQDLAYQKEVDGNPAQRHHVRFWRAPEGWLLPGGNQVDWLAAGTYDRAVGLSAFTLQVTHKIDAEIDAERDYIVDDLRWATPAVGVERWERFFTGYHDTNGGGDRVVTDGALAVLDLREVPLDAKATELADQAHRIDHEARVHTRPGHLVAATALLGVWLAMGAAHWAVIMAGLVKEVGGGAVALFSVLLLIFPLLVLLLALLTWRGRARARTALMVTLALVVAVNLSSLYAGEESITWLLASSSLAVLALLELTARPVQAWERLRAGERQARKQDRRQARRGGRDSGEAGPDAGAGESRRSAAAGEAGTGTPA